MIENGGSDFILHPRLQANCLFLADWSLSRVLLMNDRRFPWLVLVPRRPATIELHDLESRDRCVLTEEMARAGRLLKTATGSEKINLGALGNIVPQLHVHVVGRRPDDAAWPGPVWGSGLSIPYPDSTSGELLAKLRRELA